MGPEDVPSSFAITYRVLEDLLIVKGLPMGECSGEVVCLPVQEPSFHRPVALPASMRLLSWKPLPQYHRERLPS